MGQNTAILDIGSSKVICLICGTDGRDNILVQGAGIKEYPGYKHGAFEDEQQLADAIIDALSAAEGGARGTGCAIYPLAFPRRLQSLFCSRAK